MSNRILIGIKVVESVTPYVYRCVTYLSQLFDRNDFGFHSIELQTLRFKKLRTIIRQTRTPPHLSKDQLWLRTNNA
jgi:hypothetical protein